MKKKRKVTKNKERAADVIFLDELLKLQGETVVVGIIEITEDYEGKEIVIPFNLICNEIKLQNEEKYPKKVSIKGNLEVKGETLNIGESDLEVTGHIIAEGEISTGNIIVEDSLISFGKINCYDLKVGKNFHPKRGISSYNISVKGYIDAKGDMDTYDIDTDGFFYLAEGDADALNITVKGSLTVKDGEIAASSIDVGDDFSFSGKVDCDYVKCKGKILHI